MRYLESLQKSLLEIFKGEERVLLLGEDILDPYGGAFKVTAGLSTRFPERVISTPISEAAIVGIATGLALRGFLPLVEIMFGDFLTLCADQIVNHATKFEAMYGGQVKVPMVIRTPMGGGRGYGPTHSQSLEKMYLGVPYLTIVAPSHAHDPGKLLKSAVLEDASVVLFLESKRLYPVPLLKSTKQLRVWHVSEKNGYETALVANFYEGSPDVTLVGYGGVSLLSQPILERLGEEEIRVLCVFPSCLNPLPIETVADMAKKSGRVIIVEEGGAFFNWGSEAASALYERLWHGLEMPIKRLSARNTIVPASKSMEDQVLVTPENIEGTILEAIEWRP